MGHLAAYSLIDHRCAALAALVRVPLKESPAYEHMPANNPPTPKAKEALFNPPPKCPPPPPPPPWRHADVDIYRIYCDNTKMRSASHKATDLGRACHHSPHSDWSPRGALATNWNIRAGVRSG